MTNIIDCREFNLSDINPVLEKRIQFITESMAVYSSSDTITTEAAFSKQQQYFRQLADDLSEIESEKDSVMARLDACRVKLEKMGKIPLETVVITNQRFGTATISVKRVYKVDKVAHAKAVQAIYAEEQKAETELNTLKIKLEKIEEEIRITRKQMQNTSASKTMASGDCLEKMVRSFRGDEIAANIPEFNEQTCIQERFNSFVNDVNRPLLTFQINGEKVFDKTKLKNGETIKDLVVADLGKYELNRTDFYKVLEFFHQGGTTQGYAYYTEQFAPIGLSPKGIGPEATVELQIEQGTLRKLVSTADYVIIDANKAVEENSSGVVVAEGKKRCTTTYDFITGKVNLSIVAIPFAQGEAERI